ncbi:MAG: AAA family ATPase [Lachnospiraceae bacterium]|nr:AAA family ATPase [Lachnospiraceae bacterium]
MIIKELYLKDFGQFHDRKITLKPGINILYGENEAGKTTVHTFIRGMLFGLERGRGRAARTDDYTRYEPWDAPGAYAGSMRFETDGITYRMDREFKTERKMVRVVREDTGAELDEEGRKILFGGLFEESYYNTVSVTQLGGRTDADLAVVLKQYAANLASTRHAQMNLKKASEYLKDRKKKITKENQVDRKAVWKNAWIQADRKDAELSRKAEELDQRAAGLEVQMNKLRGSLENEQKLEREEMQNLRALQSENRELSNRRLELTKEQKNLQAKIGEKREQIGRMTQELDAADFRSLNDVLQKMHQTEQKISLSLQTLIPAILLVAASVCVYVAYFAGRLQQTRWIAGAGALDLLAVLLLALCVVLTGKNQRRKEENLEELEEYRQVCMRLASAKEENEDLLRELTASENREERVAQSLRELEEAIKKKIEGMPAGSKKILASMEEQNVAQNQCQWEMSNLAKEREKLEAEQSTIAEMLEKIGKAEEEIRAMDLAAEKISEAATAIRGNFGTRLNDLASFYISEITGGKYDRLIMDEDLKIRVHTDRRVLDAEQLSKGTIEQIYLSLRLAAAELIFENDPKPMLLDDAFVNYDNQRMAMTMRALAAQVEQTVLFTCHTREKAVADRNNISYHYVKLQDKNESAG